MLREPRPRPAWFAVPAAFVAAVLCGALGASAPPNDVPDWLRIVYGELVDRRRPSHSGETVGELLTKLGGRPLPPPGERREDRMTHGLLDPLVEPYGFVLADALDTSFPLHEPPYVEVGSLWLPGGAEPAWAELLRARRFLVESDGAGGMRVFLPWEEPAGAGSEAAPVTGGRDAARAAWSRAWPLLRHVFAAERRRLGRAPGGGPAPLTVEVHAYRHLRERSAFDLSGAQVVMTVDDLRPDGLRPPLDLGDIRRFLTANLLLEGARIEPDGSLRLLGSQRDADPSMLGRALTLADFAVAHRAVAHGGLAEPYMSLDRGYYPEQSLVNYGGRLRDTALGLVSLLCDIRFKTFSLGLDVVRGVDRRDELRAALPDFRTHLERLALDPRSTGLVRQQTRLWFYPDDVDLTVSPDGDVLVLRKVRMSAAAERFGGSAVAEQAPWTTATVAAINRDYDELKKTFPEMADLDQVVRLLSLFAWLRSAEAGGLLVPELDALLAAELPELPTPRSFPQLVSFNVLPAPQSETPLLVVDRVPYAAAVGRLHPLLGPPLAARRRFARALAALDTNEPQHAALLAELRSIDLEALDDSAIDSLTYRAGRALLLARTSIDYYRRILGELDPGTRQELAARQARGEPLRPTMLGVGGLDLDMGQALARARGRGLALGSLAGDAAVGTERARSAGGRPRPAAAPAADPLESWRRDPLGLPEISLPAHGLPSSPTRPAARDYVTHRMEVGKNRAGGGSWVLTVFGPDGPEVRSRRVLVDRQGRAERFERVEELRWLRYRFERDGASFVARREDPAPGGVAVAPRREVVAPAPGLALLEVRAEADPLVDSPEILLRMAATLGGQRRDVDVEVPRALLQRIVKGMSADETPELPLDPLLPAALGEIGTAMLLAPPSRWSPPWSGGAPPAAGEEDPARLARALGGWWAADGSGRAAVVGVDPETSPERWRGAPPVLGTALLLLPEDGFPGPAAARRSELAAAWGALPVAASLEGAAAPLVVLVSGESPDRFSVRLRELARDPAMSGKLLAAWSLAGELREDVPAALLGEGRLAGFGIAESSVIELRRAAARLAEFARAAAGTPAAGARVERLPGPFLWHF